jgi:hypothetical protein
MRKTWEAISWIISHIHCDLWKLSYLGAPDYQTDCHVFNIFCTVYNAIPIHLKMVSLQEERNVCRFYFIYPVESSLFNSQFPPWTCFQECIFLILLPVGNCFLFLGELNFIFSVPLSAYAACKMSCRLKLHFNIRYRNNTVTPRQSDRETGLLSDL